MSRMIWDALLKLETDVMLFNVVLALNQRWVSVRSRVILLT